MANDNLNPTHIYDDNSETELYEGDEDSEGGQNEDECEQEFVYDPEEESLTTFNLVLCEKYNEEYHGKSGEEIKTHYLTYIKFKQLNGTLIQSYKNLSDSLHLEIAYCYNLPSGHNVSIIKTHWLKLIQRKWKNIYASRQACNFRRCDPNAILYRQAFGKWPENCLYYPGIRGMLAELSRTPSGTLSPRTSFWASD